MSKIVSTLPSELTNKCSNAMNPNEHSNDLTSETFASIPILVVDDDLVYLQLLTEMLNEQGFRVDGCESIEEARDLLRIRDYPIIITDWVFPGESGLKFCSDIRLKESSYHYLILMTGEFSQDKVVQGLNAGADDFIVKMPKKAELMARLNSGVRVIRQHQRLEQQKLEIKRLAETDFLTGVFNRTYLSEKLPAEIKRATRYPQSLSILITDIDHFKHINDTFGHHTGDLALQHFVNIIQKNLRRDIDWLSRYGGEEFVAVLPNTSIQKAFSVAEKLRFLVETTPLLDNDRIVSFTASFGVATLNLDQKTNAETMLKEADQKLYLSKRLGRNCVN